MSDFFKKPPTTSTPTTGLTSPGSSNSSLSKLGSQSRALSQPTPPAKPEAAAKPSTLSSLVTASKEADEYRNRPFLVYFIIDLTGSRAETRATMISYEKELARLVMESGGKHPLLCKGVYHNGAGCSNPIPLNNEKDVAKFFDTDTVGGGTYITAALEKYGTDAAADPILSLAVLIGDASDGDDDDTLLSAACRLKSDDKNRPVVVAYECVYGDPVEDAFCRPQTGMAARIGEASGGFSFGLKNNPHELIELLKGYKKILNSTPDELKKTAQNTANGAFPSLSPMGREFMLSQTKRLVTPLLKGPQAS